MKCSDSACIEVDIYTGEHLAEPVVRVWATETDTKLQARIGEWIKFVAEIKAGVWDHIAVDYEFAAPEQPERARK